MLSLSRLRNHRAVAQHELEAIVSPNTKRNSAGLVSRPPLRRSQSGVVLFIALIVLVAMTLAGIGLVRSVSTGNLIAGNLAFKQSAVNAGELAIESAMQWLAANTSGTVLNADNTARGYSSAMGVVSDWTDASVWQYAFPASPTEDAAGNKVQTVIHRMCTNTGAYNATGNQCALQASTTAGTGTSKAVGSYVYNTKPMAYYRVTTRIQGPRNTTSYIQAMLMLPL